MVTVRIDDNGVAHGLRQHSIGSTFPAVIVGHYADKELTELVYYVQFAGHRSIDLPGYAAQDYAEVVASEYRAEGHEATKDFFTNHLFYQGSIN